VDITVPGGLWSLSPLGALVGGLVWFYLSMSAGRLLSRKQHDEIVAAEKRRGDEWKETSLEYRSAIRELEARSVVLPDLVTAAALHRVKSP
jgi:hypothetical protein